MNAVDMSATARQSETLDVRLTAIRYAARNIHLFDLEAVAGQALPDAEPGAHIEVHLPGNIIRYYSLVVPERQPRKYVIGVKRESSGRGGSAYMHDHLRVGMTLKISVPRNNFKLVETLSPVVLIAGGIGITPLFSMARRLEEAGRSWTLIYSARSRAEAAFYEELRRDANVRFHFDDENPGQFLDLAGIIQGFPAETHFYCCGPAPMLQAFEAAANSSFPPDQIHVEYFAAVQKAATEGGFVVELARRKQEFKVLPGQTILNVLLDAGLPVAHSCTEGICGACEVRVLSGVPDHRDSVLTSTQHAEGRRMMICCSGSKTDRIVIDI